MDERRDVGEVEPTHSPEGVDLTLIRWMLSLSPLERLEALQGSIDAIRRLRGEDVADWDPGMVRIFRRMVEEKVKRSR